MNTTTITGILDLQRNSAILRTEDHEVFTVPMSLVRKNGLRSGDTLTGPLAEVTRTPLSEVDTVNGMSPENARNRPDFSALTPLHPNERLRLETEPHRLTGRVIDLLMPVGKGQRALIVAPPKAGKTTVLQDIAHGISKNHPECHLMAVLVGERPEEVTDIRCSMPGEALASTFDCPPAEHITVAELAIERAKRLVESGRDVVVLLAR